VAAATVMEPVVLVPLAPAGSRVGDVRSSLTGQRFESAVEVVVLDGEHVLGLVSIEEFLAADPGAKVDDLLTPATTIGVGTDEELAAAEMARNGGRSLVVVAQDGAFSGLMPPQRAVGVLFHEHEEDMARLGGFLSRTSKARAASEESVGLRLWHRLPWLVIGLAGAMLSAGIVGAFEEELARQVLLAFFVPSVVYMADAVGTQTEAIVIRGISVGVPARDIVVRELVTGLVLGVLVAACFFPFALGIWGDERVAATVALALFASTSTATVMAMALPYALNALGRDPAFGSGPLATVIQDLLSILIYFAVAVALAA
jgi:magnesium transporter